MLGREKMEEVYVFQLNWTFDSRNPQEGQFEFQWELVRVLVYRLSCLSFEQRDSKAGEEVGKILTLPL